MPLTAVHVRRRPDMFSQILADLLEPTSSATAPVSFLQPRDVRTHTIGTREDQGRIWPQPATRFETQAAHASFPFSRSETVKFVTRGFAKGLQDIHRAGVHHLF